MLRRLIIRIKVNTQAREPAIDLGINCIKVGIEIRSSHLI